MGEGPFQQFGAAVGNGSTSYTPPSMSPMQMGGGDQLQGAATNFQESMRSFKDSLAFSFQTLNLTLSSLNQSMVNMTTKIGQIGTGDNRLINDPKNQYLAAGQPGYYLGGMSQNFATYAGQATMWDLLRGRAPASTNQLEFYAERNNERAMRGSSLMIAGAAGLGTEILTNKFGLHMGNKLATMLGLNMSGWTGMLGSAALGMPFFTLGSAALGAVVDPMVDAAIQHNKDVSAVRRMSTRFGQGFDLKQAQEATKGIEKLAIENTLSTTSLDPRMGMKGFRELTLMGLQGNLFQGTTPEDLVKEVENASRVVKFMAGIMGNKDVKETVQLVKQMKDMGVNLFKDDTFAKQLSIDAFKYGKVVGTDPNSMLATAANLSVAAYGQYGNPAFVGIQSGMRNLAYTQELEKRGILTPAEIAAGGGVQAIAGRSLQFEAAVQNSWGIGKPMMFAGMTAGGRGFSQEKFSQSLARGGYFGVLGDAVSNMWSNGITGYATAIMNQNNIMADAAKKGVLDTNTEDYIRARLEMMPDFNRRDITLQEKVNLAAMYIQDMAQNEFGTPMDTSTAKQWATKIVRPSLQKSMEERGDKVVQRGIISRRDAQNSFWRPFERIGEGFDKRIAEIHYEVTSPARRFADTLSGLFMADHPELGGDPFGKDTAYGTRQGAEAFNTAKRLQERANMLLGKATGTLLYNKDDLLNAFDALQNPDSFSASDGKFGSLLSVLQYNQMIDQKDAIKEMLAGPKESAAQVLARIGKYNPEAKVTLKDLKDFNSLSNKKWDAIGATYSATEGLIHDFTVGAWGQIKDINTIEDAKGATGRLIDAAGRNLAAGLGPDSGIMGAAKYTWKDLTSNGVNLSDLADYAYRDMDLENNGSPTTIRINGARFLNAYANNYFDETFQKKKAQYTNSGVLSEANMRKVLGDDLFNEYFINNPDKKLGADAIYSTLFATESASKNLNALAEKYNVDKTELRGQLAMQYGDFKAENTQQFLLAKAAAAGLDEEAKKIGMQVSNKSNMEAYSMLDFNAQRINLNALEANTMMKDYGINSSMAVEYMRNDKERAAIREFYKRASNLESNGDTLTSQDYSAIYDVAGPGKHALLDKLLSSNKNKATIFEDLAKVTNNSEIANALRSNVKDEAVYNGMMRDELASVAFEGGLSKRVVDATNSIASAQLKALGFKVESKDEAQQKLDNLTATIDTLDAKSDSLSYEQRQLISYRDYLGKSNNEMLRKEIVNKLGKEQGTEVINSLGDVNLDDTSDVARSQRTMVENLLLKNNATEAFLKDAGDRLEAFTTKDTAIDSTVVDYNGTKAAQVVIVGQDLKDARAQVTGATTQPTNPVVGTPQQGPNPDDLYDGPED